MGLASYLTAPPRDTMCFQVPHYTPKDGICQDKTRKTSMSRSDTSKPHFCHFKPWWGYPLRLTSATQAVYPGYYPSPHASAVRLCVSIHSTLKPQEVKLEVKKIFTLTEYVLKRIIPT